MENNEADNIAEQFFTAQNTLDTLASKVSRTGLLRAFKVVSTFPFVGDAVDNLKNVHETELVKAALHVRGLADGFMKTPEMNPEVLQEAAVDQIVENVTQGVSNNGN